MKKLFKFLLVLIVLLVLAGVLIPILFKDRIVQVVKDNVNSSLNAQVDFGDFDLTLLRNFPDFTFQVEDISIDGLGEFDSLRLAFIDQASFTLDLNSVIKGEKLKIRGISIDGAELNAYVTEEGIANYDILKEEEDETGETTDARDEYVILLEEYELTNSKIIYDNKSLGAYLLIDELDHTGNGKLTDKQYDLNTNTKAGRVDVRYEGVNYMKKADAEITANFDIQDDFREYNLNENEIRVNQLFLTAKGLVELPEDGIEMDITYEATKTDLKNLLSLIPEDYLPDLEGLETLGKINLNGTVKGHYDDDNLPGFTINAKIADGRINYPDLPKSIENIQMLASLIYPGGVDFNSMQVNIPDIHMDIADSPINGSFFLKTPLTDPYIETIIRSQLNLTNVREAIKMEGVDELNGIITADVDMKGNMSAIEEERYQDFKATGKVILQDFDYEADSLPVDVHIKNAFLKFSPQKMELTQFSGQFGKTDLKGSGTIDNYMGYFLKDELLHGRFETSSSVVDLNEFMEEGESTGESDEEVPMSAIPVPANVDVVMNSSIDNLYYGDMDIKNVKGSITVKEEVASMKNVKMDMLNGRVSIDGDYSTKDQSKPTFDMKFNIDGMDITTTANTFNTVSTLAPVAKQSKGNFSTGLTMSTALDEEMNPIFSTLDGGGSLFTDKVMVENLKPLVKIAEALKMDQWARQSFNNVKFDYTFEDGKVNVKPFDINIDGMESRIGGSMSFEQDLDYNVQIKVPTAKLGGQANSLIEGLVGKANALGVNLSVSEFVNMNFKVTGKMDDPVIKPSILGQEGSTVTDVVKETVTQMVDSIKDEKIEDGKEIARAEAAKIIADAQKQADKLMVEANKGADQIRAEAAKGAQKLVDEAKGPIAKPLAKVAGEKLKKEADKRANKAVAEAQKKADGIIAKAEQKAADKLK